MESKKRNGVNEFTRNGRKIVTRKKSKEGRPTADYYKGVQNVLRKNSD